MDNQDNKSNIISLKPSHGPCRLCPHVVIVVGFVFVNDLWGYAVEPLMVDRPKVRFQTKRDTGLTPYADGRVSLPGHVCSSDVPVQANQQRRNSGKEPHSLKKAKLESATQGGSCRPWEPFKRDTVNLASGAIENTAGVVTRKIAPLAPKKKWCIPNFIDLFLYKSKFHNI